MKNLSYKTNVKGHFTGFESLIKNNLFINFLKSIQPEYKNYISKNFIIQGSAWGNIM
jgi:hypothetical protein